VIKIKYLQNELKTSISLVLLEISRIRKHWWTDFFKNFFLCYLHLKLPITTAVSKLHVCPAWERSLKVPIFGGWKRCKFVVVVLAPTLGQGWLWLNLFLCELSFIETTHTQNFIKKPRIVRELERLIAGVFRLLTTYLNNGYFSTRWKNTCMMSSETYIFKPHELSVLL